jgi:AbrB family looped-hinge helix DNA binding protein
MTTSVRVQAKGQVTIPKEIREKLKVQPGDLVVFVETEDGVLVKPAVVLTDDRLRDEVTEVMQSIRERFVDYSAEEISALVAEALQETRRESK